MSCFGFLVSGFAFQVSDFGGLSPAETSNPDNLVPTCSLVPCHSSLDDLLSLATDTRPTAACSRFMAAATPSLSPKIADPATSTLAPASTTSGAVVASMPPSTSRSQPGLISSIICRTRRIFGKVVGMKC